MPHHATAAWLLRLALLLWLKCGGALARTLGDEESLLQVKYVVEKRAKHAGRANGHPLERAESNKSAEQLTGIFHSLAMVGEAQAALAAVPKARFAQLDETKQTVLVMGLEEIEKVLYQLLLLLPPETLDAAVWQAGRSAPPRLELRVSPGVSEDHWGSTCAATSSPCVMPFLQPALPWHRERPWLWPIEEDVSGLRRRLVRSNGSKSNSRDAFKIQWRAQSGLDREMNGTKQHARDWANASVGEAFEVHEAPKRDRRLFIVNLFLVLFAFFMIIVVIANFSPIRGAGSILRNEDGNVEVKEWHCSRFAQVCLPFWVPVDRDTQGWLWLWVFAMSCITGISLGFLYAMATMKIALTCNPDVFSQYTGSSLKVEAFRSWKGLVASLVGLFALPLQFLIFRKELRGREGRWFYLTIELFLMFQSTFVGFYLTFVDRTLQNWLVLRDADSYWHWQRTFVVVFSVQSCVLAILESYVGVKLRWHWNRYMINYVLDRYLAKRSYYHLNSNSNKDDGADNPDARLCQDVPVMIGEVNDFVFSMLELIQGLITSLLLVWATIPYWTMFAVGICMVGSGISLWFSWNFLRLNYEIERKTADFRFAMMNIRSMSEPIALLAGEKAERDKVNQRFESMQMYVLLQIVWSVAFGLFDFIYNLGLTLAPSICVCMRYFEGEIDFGGISQVIGGFSFLASKLNYLHNHTYRLAALGNSVLRIAGLLRRIDEVEDQSQLTFEFTDEHVLELRNVSVCSPVGDQPLLANVSLSVGRQRLLVCGRSGVGKSSLLRAVAGIWGTGSGTVVRPPDKDCMFLPQNPYMPLGNLRDQFRYPDVQEVFDPWEWYGTEPGKNSEFNCKNHAFDEELMPLLKAVGLGDLPDRFPDGFDQNEDWKRLLSVGEQQRVSAVRCLLKKPKLAILDESTSALSELDEQLLYRQLHASGVPYVSVGHRSSLLNFHDVVLLIKSCSESEVVTPEQYAAYMRKELAEAAPPDEAMKL